MTTGAGNFTVWVQRFFRFSEFGTQATPRSGAMGYDLPAALAAAALGKPAVAFSGDGNIMMNGSELATAMRHRLPVVVLVINNNILGTIRMHQERRYPGRPMATDLTNPDFVAFAASFGVPGFLAVTTEEFEEHISEAFERVGPTLIQINTDPNVLLPGDSPAPTSTEPSK